jgi:polysaccharide export outer membrane protein
MPVGLLDQIKRIGKPGAEAVAFLGPVTTRVTYASDIDPDVGAEPTYRLDSGDVVRVFVYGQPNLSRSYPVDGSGYISVPLIGTVRARGLMTAGLGHAIGSRLSAGFVKDPSVSVDIVAYRPFYILGEVRAAGQYPFTTGLTVQQAVAIAGGYTARADKGPVCITRTSLSGEVTAIHVLPTERVRPGDTITVGERWF